MRVLLRGPLLTLSGYGVHSRQIFSALKSIHGIDLTVECLNWGKTPWLINGELEDGLIGEIMLCSKKIEPKYDVTIQVQLPDEWNPNLGEKNIGISAFVETDKCNPEWIEKCNLMDAIVVPSNFTKSVIEKTGTVNKPLLVIPEWFNQQIIKNKNKLETLSLETENNFLVLGQLNSAIAEDDRKNIFHTIKWLCEAFSDRDDVGIVVKTNMGRNTSIDRKLTTNILKQMKHHIPDSKVKIYLLHGSMTSSEIAQLYKHDNISCLVSATRGEGYGLPLIEAAASGLPVIATNWSGHLDFLPPGKFLPIDYELSDIKETRIDNRIFFKGFKWAEPKEESFKEQVNKFLENKNTYTEIAKEYSVELVDLFSKNKIIEQYRKIVFETLGKK